MKSPRAESPGPAASAALRRFLFGTAACTGAAIMIIEILGAKMLAPYFGTSHFVWTAQIGVTLVALAAGYAAGGWLVDRSPRLRWIYVGILMAAAWLCGAVLGLEPAAFALLHYNLATGTLLAAAMLFFVPLALLAMVGPFFARMLARQLDSVGRTVGRLTSLSTLGSVAGTVLIGYVLIPLLPNSVTMFATAAGLLLLAAVYFAVWERRGLPPVVVFGGIAAFVGFLGAARPTLASQGGWRELHRSNSNFGLLQVLETPDGSRRFYLNDLLMQNSYDPKAQESASLFTHMLHALARSYAPQVRDVLCIGMGVGIVPMQFARAGANVDVVEINPDVVPLARQHFHFEPERVRLTIGDGRQFLARAAQATHRYDVIVLDAFLGESPPAHLMSREAFTEMRNLLKPGGVLVMNAFGEFEAGKDFLLASLADTLAVVFKSQRVHAAGNGNVFFVASDLPDLALRSVPDFAQWPEALRELGRRGFASRPNLEASHGRVLTDDFNPVDVRDAANREDLRRRLALGFKPD